MASGKQQTSSTDDLYAKSANGKTAGSYTTDGRWNLGGWSTYPTADARRTARVNPGSEQQGRR